MNTAQPSMKAAAQVALCAMAMLFILSIIFFRERLFADTSYIAFNIVNYKNIAVQNQRYGSFITQIVPYFGQKLHLPLRTILMAYSVSFNFFFLLVAIILFSGLRQYALTVLMAMYYYLIASDSYFLANDEIHQAIAWMFLMFGILLYNGRRNANIILTIIPFLLFAFLALFTHFIVIIPIMFLWVYFIIEPANWPFSRQRTILFSLLLIALIVVKSVVSSSQQYEQEHLHLLTHFSIGDILAGFVKPVNTMFYYRCVINYWSALILFVAGIIALNKRGNKMLIVWVILSFIGYIIMMGLTYRDLDKNVRLFHIETEWQSLGVIMAAPFIFSILPRMGIKRAAFIVSAIFIVRIVYITCFSAPSFTWRVHYNEQVLVQMKRKGITKLALYREQKLGDKYILEWTAPYESLLASAMNGDEPQRTFLFVNSDERSTIETIKKTKGIFLFDNVSPDKVNYNYFRPDTTRVYEVMTVQQFFQ